jgi:hypothetical protein
LPLPKDTRPYFRIGAREGHDEGQGPRRGRIDGYARGFGYGCRPYSERGRCVDPFIDVGPPTKHDPGDPQSRGEHADRPGPPEQPVQLATAGARAK